MVDNGKAGAEEHVGRDCLAFRGTSVGWKSGTADGLLHEIQQRQL